MQRKLSVLGSPISHSKSPAIHAAAYRVLGLDWDYEQNEVRKGGLRPFVENLGPEWLGLSLTMPLKEEAAKFAESTDKAAEATQAVNTLVRTETGWAGYNTDVFGIVQAVHQAKLSEITDVLIVGSGATATSAVAAVKQLAPQANLRIFARNEQTRDQLVETARGLGLNAKAAKNFAKAAKTASLTISTLPAGAMDVLAEKLANKRSFKPAGAIMDVAYRPWPSAIATVWEKNSRPIISGLEMLLWQAVAQIRIFTTGDPAEALPNEVAVVEAMRHSLD
jgi:shikimate dehydrogenase